MTDGIHRHDTGTMPGQHTQVLYRHNTGILQKQGVIIDIFRIVCSSYWNRVVEHSSGVWDHRSATNMLSEAPLQGEKCGHWQAPYRHWTGTLKKDIHRHDTGTMPAQHIQMLYRHNTGILQKQRAIPGIIDIFSMCVLMSPILLLKSYALTFLWSMRLQKRGNIII